MGFPAKFDNAWWKYTVDFNSAAWDNLALVQEAQFLSITRISLFSWKIAGIEPWKMKLHRVGH
jgi:hypothetical protein